MKATNTKKPGSTVDREDHSLAANLRMIEHSRSTALATGGTNVAVRDKAAQIER